MAGFAGFVHCHFVTARNPKERCGNAGEGRRNMSSQRLFKGLTGELIQLLYDMQCFHDVVVACTSNFANRLRMVS